MNLLATVVRRAIGIVLPASCVGCGASQTYLCDRCLDAAVRWPDRAARHRRAARRPRRMPSLVASKRTPMRWAGCSAGRRPSAEVHGAARHRGPSMARPMAQAASALPNRCERAVEADAVVPVPLHASKLRERGFNQALLLARGVGADAVGAPVLAAAGSALERLTNVGAQAAPCDGWLRRWRSRAERFDNVRDAFAVRRGAHVAGLRLILVDDVSTTGATLESAARALKSAGAANDRSTMTRLRSGRASMRPARAPRNVQPIQR